MPRYALKIEYDGQFFHGWQRQSNGPASVQESVETALACLEPGAHRINAAGRTDAGVHATAQVVSFDLSRDWAPFRLQEALNYHIKPAAIAIIGAAKVAPNFHARFSARERVYIYRLVARRPPLTHDRGKMWQVHSPLNLPAMREGAQHLIGCHDFTTFRATMCQASSPIKTMDEISIQEIPYPGGGREYRFTLRARSFLHNQVRSIVGSLERVGTEAWGPARMQAALKAKDREACGPVCMPDGLYLTEVRYDQDPFALAP